jgi:hypothetical protein
VKNRYCRNGPNKCSHRGTSLTPFDFLFERNALRLLSCPTTNRDLEYRGHCNCYIKLVEPHINTHTESEKIRTSPMLRFVENDLKSLIFLRLIIHILRVNYFMKYNPSEYEHYFSISLSTSLISCRFCQEVKHKIYPNIKALGCIIRSITISLELIYPRDCSTYLHLQICTHTHTHTVTLNDRLCPINGD